MKNIRKVISLWIANFDLRITRPFAREKVTMYSPSRFEGRASFSFKSKI